MNLKIFSISLFLVFALSSCNNESEDKESVIVENNNKVVQNEKKVSIGFLTNEWHLTEINSDSAKVNLNIVFSPNGDFSQVTSNSSVEGTYTISEDKKLIQLKSEKGEDKWEILELSDSVLVIFDNHPEHQTTYKFTK